MKQIQTLERGLGMLGQAPAHLLQEHGQNLVLDWILRGQKLDVRSKHSHDLVVNWYWAKHGHIMVFNWSKHGFWSIIGQKMGDPD